MSCWVRRPPPPCAIRMRSAAGMSTGHVMSAIAIVGGTRPLRRHHRRAEWMLGRALGPEHRTLPRLAESLQHETGDAFFRLASADRRHGETLLGIEAPVPRC